MLQASRDLLVELLVLLVTMCGPNHFARDCQANTVKCYACGKVGHISKDCHSSAGGSNFSAKTCYNCGKSGHISKECTA